MKPSELIKQTGWTQGTNARDKDGYPTDIFHDEVCYCAIGAIRRCYGAADGCIGNPIMNRLSKYLKSIRKHNDIATWNDDPKRTVQEVIAAFEAIGQ